MIREAELFVMAETMLLEVLGRIRTEHRNITVPPLLVVPGWDRPAPIRVLKACYARDDAAVPDLLAGKTVDDSAAAHDVDMPELTRIVEDACAAARGVSDDNAAECLLRLTVVRSFLAHELAMAIGARACPLPEELARPLFQATEPDAERWRAQGIFREPLPLPDGHVSWRDQFLLLAGRDPHPFLHD